jgi:hypothetical protein
MSDSSEWDYLHERLDQLIHQTALEIGILECKAHSPEPTEAQDKRMALARDRFWAADDAAADNHRRRHRR